MRSWSVRKTRTIRQAVRVVDVVLRALFDSKRPQRSSDLTNSGNTPSKRFDLIGLPFIRLLTDGNAPGEGQGKDNGKSGLRN